MNTPQNILYNLSYKLDALTKELQGDDWSVSEAILQTQMDIEQIKQKMDRIEDCMAVIVKLLSKS